MREGRKREFREEDGLLTGGSYGRRERELMMREFGEEEEGVRR